ncbi:MAG: OmpA family protein [Spirochaetales bacterium]|nr:OmpA family protein [Spirochaetales bacterium]
MSHYSRIFAVLFLFFFTVSLSAQEKFIINYLPGEKFKVIEKHDMSKRINGKYVGYIYREVRGIFEVTPAQGKASGFEGKYYVLEEMKRNTLNVAQKIDAVTDAKFSIAPDGQYIVADSAAFPLLRSFPAFPSKKLVPGDNWQAYGTRVVEPKRDGVYTRVKFYCDYTYKGEGNLNGVPCDIIQAQYAMRYKRGQDVYGDPNLSDISGKHMVTIYYDADRMRPLFSRDSVEETYTFADGSVETYKGFILTFYDMITTLPHTEVVKKLEDELEEKKIEDVVIEKRDEGVAITLNKIHFLPDQAVIRTDDLPRLEKLAESLKTIPDRTFLVVGHTAEWGTVESQVSLSIDRAKAIVDYLSKKGIPAERFIYQGRGSTEPVAINDTEEGRIQNRRVEIIILED